MDGKWAILEGSLTWFAAPPCGVSIQRGELRDHVSDLPIGPDRGEYNTAPAAWSIFGESSSPHALPLVTTTLPTLGDAIVSINKNNPGLQACQQQRERKILSSATGTSNLDQKLTSPRAVAAGWG